MFVSLIKENIILPTLLKKKLNWWTFLTNVLLSKDHCIQLFITMNSVFEISLINFKFSLQLRKTDCSVLVWCSVRFLDKCKHHLYKKYYTKCIANIPISKLINELQSFLFFTFELVSCKLKNIEKEKKKISWRYYRMIMSETLKHLSQQFTANVLCYMCACLYVYFLPFSQERWSTFRSFSKDHPKRSKI